MNWITVIPKAINANNTLNTTDIETTSNATIHKTITYVFPKNQENKDRNGKCFTWII